MEVISFGRTRAETIRDKNLDMIISYCHLRRGCGKGERRCPLSGICYSHPLGYLITDFTDEEIEEALKLIAKDGGFKI